MSDDLKNLELKITSTAAGTGVEQTVAGLEQVAAKTAGIGVAGEGAIHSAARLRYEVTTLLWELAAGAPSGRTLSAILGTFNPILAGAGVSGFVLFEAIKHASEEMEKLKKESTEAAAKLDSQAQSWLAIAENSKGPESALKIAGMAASALQEYQSKIQQIQKESLGWWATTVTVAQKITGNQTGGIYERERQERVAAMKQTEADYIAEANRQIELAKSTAAETERIKSLGQANAIKITKDQLQQYEEEQKGANTQTIAGLQDWEHIGEKIEAAKARLSQFQKELEKIEEQQAKMELAMDAAREKGGESGAVSSEVLNEQEKNKEDISAVRTSREDIQERAAQEVLDQQAKDRESKFAKPPSSHTYDEQKAIDAARDAAASGPSNLAPTPRDPTNHPDPFFDKVKHLPPKEGPINGVDGNSGVAAQHLANLNAKFDRLLSVFEA